MPSVNVVKVHTTVVPDDEEEEEELVTHSDRAGAASAIEPNKPPLLSHSKADEFDLDIEYVPAKQRKGAHSAISVASSAAPADAKKSFMSLLDDEAKRGDMLDRYEGSELPDDTDHPQDKEQYEAWKRRQEKRGNGKR